MQTEKSFKNNKINGFKVIRKLTKHLFVVSLSLLLSFQTIYTVSANENNNKIQNNFTIEQLENYAEELHISVDEIINLEHNLSNAFTELNMINEIQRFDNQNQPVTVQVSENLFLTSTMSVENLGRSNVRFSDTLDLRNNFGITVVTLRSHATFNVSGGRVSAVDGSTSHTGILWNLQSGNAAMSTGASSSAWVRNTFSGEFNIGIDPISINLQSFQYNNTITVNASNPNQANSRWN